MNAESHEQALEIVRALNERLVLSGRFHFEDDFSDAVRQVEEIITRCDFCGESRLNAGTKPECSWTHKSGGTAKGVGEP